MGNMICLLLGYLIGSLSPAAVLSRLKNKNLREHGTGNLGATNTMLVFGKSYGVFVMAFDIAKAILASRLARRLFPHLYFAGLLAGCGAVIGHIFPLYLKFQGGKGLAAFGGMVLSYDPMIFLILLTIGLVLMFVYNYGVILPVSAAVLFPFLAAARSGSVGVFVITAGIDLLIIAKHRTNMEKAREGDAVRVREYVKENFLSRAAE